MLNKLKYCSKFSNPIASQKTGWFHGKAAVAQIGRAADFERHKPFEAEAVNQQVVGSSPTGGATINQYLHFILRKYLYQRFIIHLCGSV